MPVTHDFRVHDEGGTRIELHRRDFDGVDTDHSSLLTVELSDARDLHASLGQAIGKAEANEVVLREARHEELRRRRIELEREIRSIDEEVGT